MTPTPGLPGRSVGSQGSPGRRARPRTVEAATRTAALAILAVGVVGWSVGARSAATARGNSSDIIRQWNVCQYVNSSHNPYALAREILLGKYGRASQFNKKIFSIPKHIPPRLAARVPPGLGPPEATYPPPAVGMLALTVGLVPDPGTASSLWFAMNVAAVGLVAVGLTRQWCVPPGGGTVAVNLPLVMAALLLFPATYSALEAGQFSLIVLGLLLAASDPSLAGLARGAALGVALVKPSVALPFLFLPLVRREWRVLSTAIAIQALATAYVVAMTGAAVSLFRDWLTVAGYFLQGMYTLQDWLNPVVSPRTRWVVPGASSGVLALCGITLAAARHLPSSRLFSVAAVTSVFWTYHGSYDFVLLLPVLLPIAGWSHQQPGRRWSATGLALFAVLAIALTQPVMRGDDVATRAIRWTARAAVIGLFLREYLGIWRSILHTGDVGHQAPDR